MWKPSSVVPQHRNRAVAVWVAILLAAFGYTVWQTTVVIRKRQNPSTKLVVSNQRYQFPMVSVCLADRFGCGYNDSSIDSCVGSAIWASGAWYGNEYIEPSEGEGSNCVEFDLTRFQVPEGERDNTASVKANIFMDWISSDNAAAETDYNVGVYVIMGKNDSNSQSGEDFTLVPYSRNAVSSDDRSYETTAMTIGKTHRKYLSGDSVTKYPVLTTASTTFVTTPDFDLFSSSSSTYPSNTWLLTEDSAIGTLFLEITQGSYSNTNVEDIEPLEIGALFGNIGGFWELLVLAWGVFFITKSRDAEPTLKARNFAKAVQRGTTNKRKRPKPDSAAAEEAGGDGARPPDWDLSDDDMLVSDGSDSGVSDKGESAGRQDSRQPAEPRRPGAYPLPRRSLSNAESFRLGMSAMSSNTLLQSQHSPVFTVGETGSATASTTTTRRCSAANAAIAASNFATYDARMVQTRKSIFTVDGRGSCSFSDNPKVGVGEGNARLSFFPTPNAAASRIRSDIKGESPRSTTRPAQEANEVENGQAADENELELGYRGGYEGATLANSIAMGVQNGRYSPRTG